jgi:hypothetical protein
MTREDEGVMNTQMAPMEGDRRIVQELEAVYRQIAEAVEAGSNPERSGVLSSLQVMLEPSIRAARLLIDDGMAEDGNLSVS